MTQRDVELMLGLCHPWHVAKFEIDHETRRVTLRIECSTTTWADPETKQPLHIHGWTERTWRHLDLWQYETELIAMVPRVIDPLTKKTLMVNVPWATPFSRWTKAFERLALEVLQMANSIKSACKLLRIGHDTAQSIMDRAVARGMARRGEDAIEHAGVDEKSLGRGHDYVTVLTDIQGKRVIDVAPGATKEAVHELVASLPQAQQQSIKAVAMDRSPTYVAAVQEELPDSVIVHDAYHLSADLNKALDKVRREEHRILLGLGDDTLTHTKYQWLRNPLNMDEEQMAGFEFLTRLNLKTARAWQIKELFAGFWQQPDVQSAAAYFDKWYKRTRRSRLEPMKKLAASFKASLPRMLTWYSHRISNAMAEGYNSAIQAIKTAARGFRSFQNYRTRILFYLGKLDLSLT